jgi:hypothetical protein
MDSNTQQSYKLCKLALKSTLILAHPIEGLPYRLYTDTSYFTIGAILQQIQPNKIFDLKGTRLYKTLQNNY